MFKNLFGFASRKNRDITMRTYNAIVAAARQPRFYSHLGVPDTPLGRFEMLAVHMFLFLHRMRGAEGAGADLAQEVVDLFVTDLDHSLRELGIGDIGIPKRVKKLTRMFYGRVNAYGAACDSADIDALAIALRRNIRPDAMEWPEAMDLATYMLAADRHLALQRSDDMLRGMIAFMPPGDPTP